MAALRISLTLNERTGADQSLDDFHQLRAAAATAEIEVAEDPVR